MKNDFNDIGEQWLKENDPLYGNRRESGYLTASQLDWVNRHEIPMSQFEENELEYILLNYKHIT